MKPQIVYKFINYILFLYFFSCISTLAYEGITFLKIDKKCIINTSKNSISFQGIASNNHSYKVGLSCFHNSRGYKAGSLRVLKSEYHVGADITFPYSECLNLKEYLENGTKNILLSWDQKSFDDFISGKLIYKVLPDSSS